MHSLSYYSISDGAPVRGDINRGSIRSDKYPIAVNCAGNFKASFSFTTDNPSGRKDIYFLYIVRGEMDVLLGDITVHATAGSVIVFPPDKRYKYSYVSSGEELDYLWVHFTGSYAEQLLSECGLYPLPYFSTTSDNRAIPEKFKKLFEIFERGGARQRVELAVTLEQILLAAAKATAEKSPPPPLEKSIRFIHLSYNSKISVPELAAMENLSNSRYIALFHKQMGMSPSAYIIDLRMNAACELLQSTDISVKQIGLLVGYEDPHFFSKLFKKHIGVSPKEYKLRVNQ